MWEIISRGNDRYGDNTVCYHTYINVPVRIRKMVTIRERRKRSDSDL